MKILDQQLSYAIRVRNKLNCGLKSGFGLDWLFLSSDTSMHNSCFNLRKPHSLIDCFIPLASLILILNHILLLKLPHPLDFIEIHHEALLVSMIGLDTLPAENSEMVRAIKMLDSLWMLFTQLITQSFFILIIKVKISLLKNRIFLNNLIKDVYVQRKSLCTFQLLD